MDPNLVLKTPMPKQPAAAAQVSQSNIWTDGWFKVKKLDLDLDLMRKTCTGVHQMVQKRYGDLKGLNYYENQTTNLFGNYNIFLFSSAPLHSLFRELVTFWNQIKPDDDIYYLQSWLNVYDKSKSIGWHYHWTEKYNAWHGFYCVDVDVSKTSYCLAPPQYQESKKYDYQYQGNPVLEYNEEYEIVNVVGRDNFMVLSRSAGDTHRNIPWNITDRPRMTIAFDIVPGRHIFNEDWENHWIPLI